jgi:hypothetical protein
METNLFLAYLTERGELTGSQRRRIQIKLGAMAESLDQALLHTGVLDRGAVLRLREEYRQWRATAPADQVERLLQGQLTSVPARSSAPAEASFSRSVVTACLEDALAKGMESVVLRFDAQSRPALEILYRYGPHVRDAMAFQEQLAHQIVAEVHELAGTGPLPEPKTTVFQLELRGAQRVLTLRQSERRQGRENLEIRLTR